jgi:hypothetical protein
MLSRSAGIASSVGIATNYGMEGSGYLLRWKPHFKSDCRVLISGIGRSCSSVKVQWPSSQICSTL